MSRYIDADNLHNAKFQNTDGYGENVAYRLGWNEAIEAIEENEPTAIDIVRCKECKHAHMTYGGDCKYCDMWKDDDDFCIELYLDGDFYCSYGERNE